MSSSHASLAPKLERLARGLLYAALFVTPLFFLPFTSDILELNKQTLMVALTMAASLAWLGSMHVSRTISFRRGAVNALPVLLLVSAIVSAAISKAPYLSWMGGANQQYTSVLSILCYAALFFLVTNLLDRPARQGMAYAALLSSVFIASIVGIFALCGLYLPFAAGTVNSVGTVNSLGILLITATVLGNAWAVSRRSHASFFSAKIAGGMRALVLLLSLSTLSYLILVDYWVLWTVLLIGLGAMFAFVLARAEEFPDVGRLTLPFFLTAFSLLFLFWLSSPVQIKVPVEVMPSFRGSTAIIWQEIRQSPVFGDGPGTFTFAFASARPVDLNQTSFWDVRFDRPASFLFLLPAAYGIVGSLVWLAFILCVLIQSVRHVLRRRGEEWVSLFVLGTAWVSLLAGLALYSANITLLFTFFALSGLLASHFMLEATPKQFGQAPRMGLILSFGFTLVSVAVVTLIFISGQRYVADLAFAKAVAADRNKGDLDTIVSLLDRAASMNRFDDVYYRNLSQALVLRLGKELAAVKDVQALKPEEVKRLQDLTAASVNASVRATVLSPQNSQNWLLSGSVYRELIPLRVTGAAESAVQAYGHAVALEPNSPLPLTELGRAYVAAAQVFQQMTGVKEEAAKKQAQEGMDKNLALAIEQFNKAVVLKPDYSPAHYQLASIYAQQGKLDEAIGKMESVAKYNDTDVGVAFQLGLLYLRRANKDDQGRAQAALEFAVKLSPSYSNARWFLASIYEQQGKLDKTLEQIQKVAELNPGNELVKSRLERLQKGVLSKTIPPPLEEVPVTK